MTGATKRPGHPDALFLVRSPGHGKTPKAFKRPPARVKFDADANVTAQGEPDGGGEASDGRRESGPARNGVHSSSV